MKASFIGRWRIVEMELWDEEFIDLESPGHITFVRDGRGKLHFGAVDVSLDWRADANGNRVNFTFDGFDVGDEVSGRGGRSWMAELEAHCRTAIPHHWQPEPR